MNEARVLDTVAALDRLAEVTRFVRETCGAASQANENNENCNAPHGVSLPLAETGVERIDAERPDCEPKGRPRRLFHAQTAPNLPSIPAKSADASPFAQRPWQYAAPP